MICRQEWAFMHVDVLSGGISFVDHYYYFPIRNYHTLNPYYRSRKVAVVSVTSVNAKDLFFYVFQLWMLQSKGTFNSRVD